MVKVDKVVREINAKAYKYEYAFEVPETLPGSNYYYLSIADTSEPSIKSETKSFFDIGLLGK